MAQLKTCENGGDVKLFLESVGNPQRRSDCFELLEFMKDVTGLEPKMWGDSIVGFGKYHYKYPTGREGDWFLSGFSPRKQNLTIYIMAGFEKMGGLMEDLGKYKTGSSCLYTKRLEDIDLNILKEMVLKSIDIVKKRYY